MCGITGIYCSDGQGISSELIRDMTDTMICRGPDDDGYYRDNDIGLGFRRLSIIDLTHGNQPMTNEDDTVVSVCNGEIYNFKELKEALAGKATGSEPTAMWRFWFTSMRNIKLNLSID